MFFDLDEWRFYLTSPDISKWTITFIVLFLLFWSYQLVQLMLMPDEDFPGRFDKVTWGAIFILAMPLAPFVFLFWRGAHKETRRRKDDDVFDE